MTSTKNKCAKVYFGSRPLAKRAMKLLNKSGNPGRKLTNVYWCDQCNGYHLTSMNKKKSRRLNHKK